MALTDDYFASHDVIRKYEYIDGFDYEIDLSRDFYFDNETDILTWLVDSFGYDEINGYWMLQEVTYSKSIRFSFVYPEQLTAFKLRWI